MKLDRTTYEAWLLDRIEGRLTPDQEHELASFLLANPDLDPGDQDELPRVDAGPGPAFDKEFLKQDLPPTGAPDLRNLDLFLVARMEGDLSAQQEAALTAFLMERPELALEARRMAAAHVPADHLPYPSEVDLRRTIPPVGMPDRHRLTDFLIAAEEGDLTAEQQAGLNALVAGDASLRRERALVHAVRIHPEAMVFPDKDSLRKGGRVVPLWSRTVVRWSVAASIALLLGLGWTLLQQDTTEEPQLAEEVRTNTFERSEEPVEQVKDIDPGPGTSRSAGEERGPVIEQHGTEGPMPGNGPTEGSAPDPAPAVPGDRPAPRELPTRMDPMLASLDGPTERPAPVDVNVEEVPMLAEAPDAGAVERATPTYTPAELLAATVRGRVLEEDPDTRPLDGKDAVAMADKGLGAISGGKAGLQVERREGRRRFSLKLGNDLAITASSGR